MGKRSKRKHRGKLTFIERLFCCCKCGAESWTRVIQRFLYVFTTAVLLSLAVGCLTVGILYINKCSYNYRVPHWMIGSAFTPYLLLVFIKAVKDDQEGVTCWQKLSLLGYGIFLSWLVVGCIWVYDTWKYVTYKCSDCCDSVLINCAFALKFVHWLFAILGAIPNMYILTKMLFCHRDENTVKPLKT